MNISTRVAVFVFVGLVAINTSAAQGACAFDLDLPIPDNSELNLELEISGLVQDDLATSQSLCGVRLQFRHNYIGDLTIELESPAGQSIKLIGEPTDLISPTNLSTWNVTFLPCGDLAVPDGGFNQTWSNDQGWQVFTSYTGSYYPVSGCLEDFNSGSANGTWILRFVDNDQQATGIVESVELLFCDDTGLDCSVCGSDAGQFGQVGIKACEGIDFSDLVFIPEYSTNKPADSLYSYQYIVSDDGTSFQYSETVPGSGWAVGSYTICGISFLKADSSGLFTMLDSLSLSDVQGAFDSDTLSYCADITSSCIELLVSPIPDTTFLVDTICKGDVVVVGNQEFKLTGVYNVKLTSQGECDSIVQLNLRVRRPVIKIFQQDTLSCENNTTALDASTSSPGATGIYEWSTDNGLIVGNPNTSIITIGAPGDYMVTVTDLNGCSFEEQWTAEVDGSFPFISITDGELTCNRPTHRFKPVAFPTQVTYQWSGPNGFNSNKRNPLIDEAGMYVLTVTDTSGCQVSIVGNVTVDTATLPTVINIVKDCSAGITTLGIDERGGAYEWSGPGGFTADVRSVDVSTPGEYIAVRTMPNGCTTSDTVVIDNDYDIPDLNVVATNDILNCAEQLTLSALSSLGGGIYQWTGPSNQLEGTDSTLNIRQPGVYHVELEAPNGCIGEEDYEIFKGNDLFTVNTFTDTLTCTEDTVLVGASFTTQAVDIIWSGPGLVDSTLQFIRVDAAGLYEVEVVDTSGCVAFASLYVEEDIDPIRFTLMADTLTCTNKNSLVSYATTEVVTQTLWADDDGFISNNPSILANDAGPYYLTLTGENGCARERAISVAVDTMSPLVFITPTSIGCDDSVQVFAVPVDSIVMYEWTGPQGFNSSDKSPFVYTFGLYDLNAIALNGCSSEISTDVTDISVAPDLAIDAELLDCIDSIATLTASSVDSATSFTWYDSEGVISVLPAVQVKEPGMYLVEVRSAVTMCTDTDSVEVLPPVAPAVYATDDVLNCVDTVLTVVAASDSLNMMYRWLDPLGGVFGFGNQIEIDEPGVYRVQGTWINGCTSDTTFEILIDTMPPLAVAYTDQEVRCALTTIVLDGSASIGDSVSFQWTTSDGDIISGMDRDSVWINGAGNYLLTLTNKTNQCTDSDNIEVIEQPNPLDSILLTVVPECQGNGGGMIIVDSVINAISTMAFSLGDGFASDRVFDGLPQGEYTLSAIDSFGCTLDTILRVTNTSSSTTVNLGPDMDIIVGDDVTLSATLDVDSAMLSGISWFPTLPCDSCLTNMFSGLLETQDFVIQVSDEFGCIATDEIRVYVAERAQYYIPNIFSPNDDGVNDVLEITAHSGVSRVVNFLIYDRWGNLVFGARDYSPGTPEGAWDGTASGEPLNPAVFTYFVEVELITGRRENRAGDVTLLR